MKWIPFFKTGKQTDSLGREKLWTREEMIIPHAAKQVETREIKNR
jgi:hypothetical protein